MTRTLRRSPRGFTLIELLVVVAIISLLIALLLPALAQARATGRSIQCLSNIRQFAIGFQVYADTYQDWIPGASTLGNSWHAKLGELETLGPLTWYTGKLDATNIRMNGFSILGCPDEKPPQRYFASMNSYGTSFWRWGRMRTSYWQHEGVIQPGYQGHARKGWSAGPTFGGLGIYPRMTGKTSQALLILDGPETGDGWEYNAWGALNVDAVFNWDAEGTAVYEPWYTISLYGFRHPGRTSNGLYWDGHAETHKHHVESGRKLFKYLFAADLPGTTGPLPSVNFWTYVVIP